MGWFFNTLNKKEYIFEKLTTETLSYPDKEGSWAKVEFIILCFGGMKEKIFLGYLKKI